MNKRIVLLTSVSVFLLSAMVVTLALAQTRVVGVNVGDWFKYSDIAVNWSSNDPNATFPPSGWEWLEETNETEWMRISVEQVSGTNITLQMLTHYGNGTEETSGGHGDIDTGDGNMTFMAISADLNANDTIYSSPEWSDMKINETITRTYPDGVRETNHLNMTYEYSYTLNETEYYYYTSQNFYWDRESGIFVESYFEVTNQTGEYLTTWSSLARITDSNVWVIPEFPTYTSVVLAFAILTVSTVMIKRRLLKTPTH